MNGRIWEFLKAQWDAVATIVTAILLAVLSGFGAIGEDNVGEVTLGVLALLCFTVIRDRQSRAADLAETRRLQTTVNSVHQQVLADRELRPVAPFDIGKQLADTWSGTNLWRFKGGTGTYLRAHTLPELALNARNERDVWIELLPPDDAALCRAYAEYRSSRQAEAGQPTGRWTVKSVRTGAYATIIAAAWFTRHTNLRVHVALSRNRSTFRFDLSTPFVMITNDDPRTRGLRVEGGSGFFESVDQELRVSFDQARQLDLSQVSLPRDRIDADDVRRALESIPELRDDQSFLTDEVCDDIAMLSMSKAHASRLRVECGGAVYPVPTSV